MMDQKKIAAFIAAKRREAGLTQQQVAEALRVSFQAVSKWETGAAFPNVELLVDLARLLSVTVDDLLAGQEREEAGLTYSKAGVDILYTDVIKKEIARFIDRDNPRVLNGLGPFASLYDIGDLGMVRPVLVLKAEEPGSKQKLAMEYGYTESICHDMINHLVNDIAVMGAKPLAVLDVIVCGKAEKEIIKSFVKGMADACRENECTLVGGETSIQPNVVADGTYILSSSIAGIVDRDRIVDGSAISQGDAVLAVASNGLHTNGYSLVRMLMTEKPQIKSERLGGASFLDAILAPHTPYYKCIKEITGLDGLHGMAHITGGGIAGNLRRIIPEGLRAEIDLSLLQPLPLFGLLRSYGGIADHEMLDTFNCGAGLILVVEQKEKARIMDTISRFHDCYDIGMVGKGTEKIAFSNAVQW